MKHLRLALIGLLLVGVLSFAFYSPHAHAAEVFDCSLPGASETFCANRGRVLFGAGGLWQTIVQAVLYLVGAAAVIMLIVSGLRYITANGDSSQIASAKNGILYSVIGLIVALLANGIVTFVINNVK